MFAVHTLQTVFFIPILHCLICSRTPLYIVSSPFPLFVLTYITTAIELVRLLRQVDSQVFSGWKHLEGLYDPRIIASMERLAISIESALSDDDALVVMSGCGTSGRIAYYVARTFNAMLRSKGLPDRFAYLVSGGDTALLLSDELPGMCAVLVLIVFFLEVDDLPLALAFGLPFHFFSFSSVFFSLTSSRFPFFSLSSYPLSFPLLRLSSLTLTPPSSCDPQRMTLSQAPRSSLRSHKANPRLCLLVSRAVYRLHMLLDSSTMP